jgi:hypothetical protein
LTAFGLLGLSVLPVAAVHAGAIVDCGTSGTFTIKTASTGAGLQPPSFFDVLVFEEHNTLTILRLTINGEPTFINDHTVFDLATMGRAHWKANEATCTFTLANGDLVEVTGVLTAS